MLIFGISLLWIRLDDQTVANSESKNKTESVIVSESPVQNTVSNQPNGKQTKSPANEAKVNSKNQVPSEKEKEKVTAQKDLTSNKKGTETVKASPFAGDITVTKQPGSVNVSVQEESSKDAITETKSPQQSTIESSKPSLQPSTNPSQETVAPTMTPSPTVVPTRVPVGSILLSIDASVIGNGTLVSNLKVPYYEGESAAHAVVRGLNQAGYTYSHTGSLESDFYLARIKKGHMISKVSLSDRVKEILDDNGVKFRENKYLEDSLGEFDFTKFSGWRYCVNGVYAGVGMSDHSIQSGDRILLKYTLCLGKDA
ncbi:hypothetical protein lbkm_2138 [Lachnospiraceae bacterium KM106-2]|nr:hypothetical protein lbkm_2138 [Lachnospiraceae bacterium KM106-2]